MNLERGDLLQMDPISCRGTLKLLPIGKKNKQKLLVGDDSGTISCYEFRKGEPQIVFQTKVFDGPISCVALGGSSPKKDKIFLSHSQRIVGLTKKGKEFFKLTSSLTETIQNISVEDTRIWTGCEFIYNLYDNGKDTAYFISKDRINHVVVAHVTRDMDYDAVLACQDNCIRIIHGSQLFLEIPTSSPVTAVAVMQLEKSVQTARPPTGLVYATDIGAFGLVQVDDPQKRCSITCLSVFDLNRDGVDEIVVGREDGRVEVYKQDSTFSVPFKTFSKDIAAYSGKIISFTTEPDDSYGRSVQTVNNENRIKHLKKEVDDLKKKAEKERERVKKINAISVSSSTSNVLKPFSAPDFSVISKFVLATELAAYVLTIELQSSGSGPRRNSCQSQEKRIILTLRTNEGEYGDLMMAVIHEWISAIFPDVPPRLDDSTTEQRYFFRNTFTGATTISNYRRVALEEFLTTHEASVPTFLALIREKLEHQLSLTRKMQLVDAVQEITMQEAGDTPWLSAEYADVLTHQETIRQEFKNRDKSLEYLSGIVTDLYVDWNKLQYVILNGTFDDIVKAFLTNPAAAGSAAGGRR
eukprot:gene32272-41825_t